MKVSADMDKKKKKTDKTIYSGNKYRKCGGATECKSPVFGMRKGLEC